MEGRNGVKGSLSPRSETRALDTVPAFHEDPPVRKRREGVALPAQAFRQFRRMRGPVNLLQTLITDYETDRLRLTAEMAVRFAMALDVSLDELLRPKTSKGAAKKTSRKVLRRVEQIETLPAHQQQTVLKSLDMMLSGLRRAS